MRQRLRFGERTRRGLTRGKLQFEAPTFGTRCVCCNGDPQFRVQSYDASTDRVSVDPVPMPVCFACKDHALSTPFAPMMQVAGIVVGASLTALGGMYAAERPGDSFLKWTMVAGVALVVLSIAWMRSSSQKRKRAAVDGHHPGLEMSFATGVPLLDTDNETLVEELLQLNPRAERMPTPLFWRLRGEGMPKARVVKRD